MTSPLLSAQIARFTAQYTLYTNSIACGAGLVGNILTILVFIRLKAFRQNRCVCYLIVESISNVANEVFLLLITYVPLTYGSIAIINSLAWCKVRYIVFQTTNLVTSSMICFGACDQFCSTNYRIRLRQMCTFKLAQCLVFTCLTMSIAHSLLLSFFSDSHALLGCVVNNPVWIQYATYFFYPVVTGFLPIIVASSFSLLAYRNVRRVIRRQIPIERRRLDQQITAMVLVRVMVYVVLSLPYTVFRVYTINVPPEGIDLLRSTIERLIQAIFYSISSVIYAVSETFVWRFIATRSLQINFYLFLASSARFRRQVTYVLKRKYCWPIKHQCCCNDNEVQPENTAVTDENFEME